MKKLFLLAFILTNIGLSNIVSAQSVTPNISLETIPLDPEALSVVTVTAKSFSLDLDYASIEWKYNGKVIASGTGKKSVKITAPENGGTAVILVTVSGSGLQSATQSIVIRPGSVDLLWEAVDAYVPPFYKGKAVLPYGGVVRVTAIPGVASPKTTTFKWIKNGIPMENRSGFGRSSILFKQEDLNTSENIGVETNNGVFSGKSSISLIPQQPAVVAYANEEGFINYSKGWSESISIIGRGALLRFEPYFFSAPVSIKNDLDFGILIDGNQVQTIKPNELSISSNDGSEGTVGVEVFTKDYSLQNVKTLFGVIFN